MELERIYEWKAAYLRDCSRLRAEHSEIMRQLCRDARAESVALPQVLRVAALQERFARGFPTVIAGEELRVGTDWHWGATAGGEDDLFRHTNGGHYIPDFVPVLERGLEGLLVRAQALPETRGPMGENRRAFLTVLSAMSLYIGRYARAAEAQAAAAQGRERARLLRIAEDCGLVAAQPPRTFRQALQLIRFVMIFLENEACAAAISPGRLDMLLYPFYERDLRAGILTEEEALELLCCFAVKASEGDESSMVTLGGQDASGACRDNALTVLFLRAQTLLQMRQPSLCLRVGPQTGRAVWEAAEALARLGGGMPAYVREDALIRGLETIGVEPVRAADFGIVGCYEGSVPGVFSNSVAYGANLADCFAAFLRRGGAYDTFADFDEAFREHLRETLARQWRPGIEATLAVMEGQTSPTAACFLRDCPENGLLPEQYGCGAILLGLNLLGVGLTADCLLAVKELVYDRHAVTLEELRRGTEENFADGALLARLREREHGYGSGSPDSAALMTELSAFLGAQLMAMRPRPKALLSPGLFQFTADIWQRNRAADANGRRQGELLSYGVMPCATPRAYPVTAALQASAAVSSEYYPDGCPTLVTLSAREAGEPGLITDLVRGFFAAGGVHIAVNGVDAKTLRAAQKRPEQYPELMVKISGFSTRFVTLTPEIQDALIRRAGTGS